MFALKLPTYLVINWQQEGLLLCMSREKETMSVAWQAIEGAKIRNEASFFADTYVDGVGDTGIVLLIIGWGTFITLKPKTTISTIYNYTNIKYNT